MSYYYCMIEEIEMKSEKSKMSIKYPVIKRDRTDRENEGAWGRCEKGLRGREKDIENEDRGGRRMEDKRERWQKHEDEERTEKGKRVVQHNSDYTKVAKTTQYDK